MENGYLAQKKSKIQVGALGAYLIIKTWDTQENDAGLGGVTSARIVNPDIRGIIDFLVSIRNPGLDQRGMRSILLQLEGQQPARQPVAVISEALPPIIERNVKRDGVLAEVEAQYPQSNPQIAFKPYQPGKQNIQNTIEIEQNQNPYLPVTKLKVPGEKSSSQRSVQEVAQARSKANEEMPENFAIENCLPLEETHPTTGQKDQVSILNTDHDKKQQRLIKDDESFAFSEGEESEAK